MPALAALAVIGTVVGAAGSIYGGIQADKSAKQEASLQREQGDIALQEAQVNASNEAYNQTQAVQRQRLAFLSNGVSLEGSPSMVLEQSKQYGQQQVDSILRQGAARKTLADRSATITENKGRSALVGGYMSAAGTIGAGAASAYNSGMFDPAKKTT